MVERGGPPGEVVFCGAFFLPFSRSEASSLAEDPLPNGPVIDSAVAFAGLDFAPELESMG